MNWEMISAFVATIALFLTIFLEWPRFVERLKRPRIPRVRTPRDNRFTSRMLSGIRFGLPTGLVFGVVSYFGFWVFLIIGGILISSDLLQIVPFANLGVGAVCGGLVGLIIYILFYVKRGKASIGRFVGGITLGLFAGLSLGKFADKIISSILLEGLLSGQTEFNVFVIRIAVVWAAIWCIVWFISWVWLEET